MEKTKPPINTEIFAVVKTDQWAGSCCCVCEIGEDGSARDWRGEGFEWDPSEIIVWCLVQEIQVTFPGEAYWENDSKMGS